MKNTTYTKPECLIIKSLPIILLSGSGTQSDVNYNGTSVETGGSPSTEDPGTDGAAKKLSLWDDEWQ